MPEGGSINELLFRSLKREPEREYRARSAFIPTTTSPLLSAVQVHFGDVQ